MGVFFLFLLAAAAGTLTTLYWIPEEELGRGYFQLNALIVLCLLSLAGAVYLLHPFQPYGPDPGLGAWALALALGAAFLYYAAVWRERWRPGRWAAALSLAAAFAALLLAGPHLLQSAAPLPYRQLLLALALAGSAALLGWSLVTMLLGHWYLISPRLSFRHLVVFCWVLIAVIGVRLLATGAGLAAAAGEPETWRLLTGITGQGMFFWFRVLWGLAIPLTLGVLSLHCARQRSNQSATGILYVVVVGAFIGEITAYYLIVTTGVPV